MKAHHFMDLLAAPDTFRPFILVLVDGTRLNVMNYEDINANPSQQSVEYLSVASIDEDGKRSRYRKFLAIMEDVRDFDAGQHNWIDVLYDVFSMLPPHEEFVVNKMDIRREKDRIILNTQAKDRDVPVQLIRTLEAFRQEGKNEPRFKVSMGPQKEKKGERYPFVQDLRIRVLKDESREKKRTRN